VKRPKPRPLTGIDEATSFILAILSIGVYFIVADLLSLHGLQNAIYSVVIPIAAAAVAIVPHELAHRFVGRSMGCFARFALDERGFVMTTLINVFLGSLTYFGLYIGGVFFSGYTIVSCPFRGFYGFRTPNEGLIKVAGPITNMALALLSIALYEAMPIKGAVASFIVYSGALNAWVAFFNLLPFGPLDGRGVIEWNRAVWLLLIVISVLIWAFYPI